jgi:drug/metabolite transporter (DMT)-like permease
MDLLPGAPLLRGGAASLMRNAAVPAGALLSAAAQVVLKKASACPILSTAWIFLFVLSAALYGLSMLVYMILLRVYPMSTIYPVITLMVILLVSVYAVLTGEHLAPRRIAGLLCAALAIVLLLG